MSRSRRSRSRRREDEVDIRYEIATPFESRDTKILLIKEGDDELEVIIADIPVPSSYNTDRNYPDLLDEEETMRCNAAAKWVVTEATKMLDDYDWNTSSSKTNNPNYHLRDIYFTCSIDEVDEAVLTAKKFVTVLEEKVVRHHEEFERGTMKRPSDEIRER